MEIKATVTAKEWLDDPDSAGKVLDSWTDDALDLLSSGGFWGSVGAVVLIALRFVPQLAPQYTAIASIVGGILAPKVHQDKVRQIEEYAGHYITTVEVIEDVSDQLPDSNGVKNLKRILKRVTESSFHNAVQTITANVHPDRVHVAVVRNPSSQSQTLTVVTDR